MKRCCDYAVYTIEVTFTKLEYNRDADGKAVRETITVGAKRLENVIAPKDAHGEALAVQHVRYWAEFKGAKAGEPIALEVIATKDIHGFIEVH